MPSGAAVIRYQGPRGVSWRIKYLDADGRQVKETLGREPEWDRRKAERALGARLADVEKGMRKPARRTFDELADEFEAVALAARPRKKRTVVDYKATLSEPPAARVRASRPRQAVAVPGGSSSGTPPRRSPTACHRRRYETTSCSPGSCSGPLGDGGG